MNKFSSSKINLFLVLLVSLLIFILLAKAGFLLPVKSFLVKLAAPFQYAFSQGLDRTKEFFGLFSSLRESQKENKELKQKITELEAEIAKLQNYEYENKILRDQLGFIKSRPYRIMEADIISWQPENFLDYFTINKGNKEGIRVGMAVVFNGVLVGKVVEVAETSSRVNLITDVNSSVNAIVQGSRANGIVRGQVGGGLLLDMVPQNEVIKSGDFVVTSALGEDFPAGLLIGRIEEVRTPLGELFQQAVLRSPVEIRKLEKVFIIIGSK